MLNGKAMRVLLIVGLIKNATGVDKSKFAKRADLANLKSKDRFW